VRVTSLLISCETLCFYRTTITVSGRHLQQSCDEVHLVLVADADQLCIIIMSGTPRQSCCLVAVVWFRLVAVAVVVIPVELARRDGACNTAVDTPP